MVLRIISIKLNRKKAKRNKVC
uniref:Uncharacterized protein n=1 Tax=Heterorhabditis bacteriophora TaxID=37862 RepID=A0A1I7WHS5_HETBA